MKQFELISSNVSESWKQRVIFATVAFGMGVNSPCVEKIIHFGVPELWRVFFKKVGELEEMGGLPHQLLIYFNNNIGANVEGMQPVMRD